MKIYAIVQARMSSKRFPGKTLYKVQNKPLISFLLETLSKCRGLDDILLATSIDKSDDPILDYCEKKSVRHFRGSLDNVAERFKDIIEAENIDAFVRLSGDSPLLDPQIIEKAVALYRKNEYDIVTNVLNRSFPKGQSVEVVNAKTFLEAYSELKSNEDKEHVMPFFYRNKDKYNIFNIESDYDASTVQLSVDTDGDMRIFKLILNKMDRPHWQYNWKEVLELRDSAVSRIQ
ncbi:MAG: NTP transferase domain-containing protein [Deltaproteobacteria bacterium]|nr:NTP transferase domain-containing protein [Deltaproteobacteria bacterium]